MTVVDIHTHMLSETWIKMISDNGAPDYAVGIRPDGIRAMQEYGIFRMAFVEEMLDYDARLKVMNAEGIDVAIVSLTGPNVYWGSPEISLAAAKAINDEMYAAQIANPDRIRYIASLPWQHPELAVAELARACSNGAVGVMVLANIRGMALSDPFLAPIWQAIDDRALPVLVHPTDPPGHNEMDLKSVGGSIPFLLDTTLAVTRLVFDGFFDRYTNLKFIASHGGAAIPLAHGRMDLFWRQGAPSNRTIDTPPSDHLKRLYLDAVVYQMNALEMGIDMVGPERVMFGTDFPHPTDIRGLLERARALPKEQSDGVLGKNAMRVFGL